MTADEIYELARRKQPAPDDLTLCERMLYTTARNIYKAYSDGIITLEEAKKRKVPIDSRIRNSGVIRAGISGT